MGDAPTLYAEVSMFNLQHFSGTAENRSTLKCCRVNIRCDRCARAMFQYKAASYGNSRRNLQSHFLCVFNTAVIGMEEEEDDLSIEKEIEEELSKIRISSSETEDLDTDLSVESSSDSEPVSVSPDQKGLNALFCASPPQQFGICTIFSR